LWLPACTGSRTGAALKLEEVQEYPTMNPPRLWAVGGGKGGVGKSVISANLAVTLARQGKSCILLDADLGGANLHTLFGIAQPRVTLTDLFNRNAGSLREILVPTPVPGLQLISGANPLLDMANPQHAQKVKILRQIRALEVDYILLDVGAGSSFNVLDFFLASDRQLVVIAPFPTSVENAYHFLKAAFFRKLKATVREVGIAPLAEQALRERGSRGIRSPGELLGHLREQHPEKGAALARAMTAYRPQLVINQVRQDDEMELGHQMAVAASDYFGLKIGCLGSIRNDDRVHYAVKMKQPILDLFPQSTFSLSIKSITRQLLGQEDASDV
jgi:flagellar biosynthesis protein FlhG